MDVAGPRLERVVHRRVDQSHDRADILADGLERQYLHIVVDRFRLARDSLQAVHGIQRFLVVRKVGGDVRAVCQSPVKRDGYALFRPGLQCGLERVAHDQQQPSVHPAQGDALPFQRLREGQRVESRREAVQHVHAEHGIVEQVAQRIDEVFRIQAGQLFQDANDAATALGGGSARLPDLLRRQGDGSRCGARGRRTHWMLPASSKMGKYISTTTTPMASPTNAISNGSNSLMKRSTQRVVSSS